MKRRTLVFAVALAACLLAGCLSENAKETPESGLREVPAAILDIATAQSFTEEAVSAEDAETILLAGINAPSAMNGQPWHFTAVTDGEVLRQIAEDMSAGMSGRFPAGGGSNAGMPGTPSGGGGAKAGIADAPLAIVVSCRDGSELDAGLACQTMSVAAILMGYGTKIVTSPTIALNGANQERYRELLGMPEDYAAAAVLLVGHVADVGDAATSATPRNSMNKIVSWLTP